MATEKQVSAFESVYKEELERTKSLRDNARTYLSTSSIYSAFVIFVNDKHGPSYIYELIILAVSVTCMITSFLLSLTVINISQYERALDPSDMLSKIDDTSSDSDFFDDRIADYAVAYSRNRKVNDQKARRLALAGGTMLTGMIAHALYFAF
jgi:hypothetical protein